MTLTFIRKRNKLDAWKKMSFFLKKKKITSLFFLGALRSI